MDQIAPYPMWISHSSIRDFLSCPRAYFLRHVYKDPNTGKRINIINAPLALGNSVHDVLEEISILPHALRFEESLIVRYENAWKRVAGELGGFKNNDEESLYKKRGEKMLKNIMEHPGPIANKTVKLHSDDQLPPRYLFSPEENIILCGKVDWLEYIPENDSVHIIDFKTGTKDEDDNSLQLSIYALLVKNCQQRIVKKISYWYLERENAPREMSFPDFEQAYNDIMQIALRIKQLRKNGIYDCPRSGCFGCRELEMIINGEAKYIKTSGYQDIYSIP